MDYKDNRQLKKEKVFGIMDRLQIATWNLRELLKTTKSYYN